MSLAGSCFSSEWAPRPFHHGVRRQGGTILGAVARYDAVAGVSRQSSGVAGQSETRMMTGCAPPR